MANDTNSLIGNYIGNEGRCEVRISEIKEINEEKVLLQIFDKGKLEENIRFNKEEFIKKITKDGSPRIAGKKGDSKIFTQLAELEFSKGEFKSVSAYISQKILPFVDSYIILGGYYCNRLVKSETESNNIRVNDASRSQVKDKEPVVEESKWGDSRAVLK